MKILLAWTSEPLHVILNATLLERVRSRKLVKLYTVTAHDVVHNKMKMAKIMLYIGIHFMILALRTTMPCQSICQEYASRNAKSFQTVKIVHA